MAGIGSAPFPLAAVILESFTQRYRTHTSVRSLTTEGRYWRARLEKISTNAVRYSFSRLTEALRCRCRCLRLMAFGRLTAVAFCPPKAPKFGESIRRRRRRRASLPHRVSRGGCDSLPMERGCGLRSQISRARSFRYGRPPPTALVCGAFLTMASRGEKAARAVGHPMEAISSFKGPAGFGCRI